MKDDSIIAFFIGLSKFLLWVLLCPKEVIAEIKGYRASMEAKKRQDKYIPREHSMTDVMRSLSIIHSKLPHPRRNYVHLRGANIHKLVGLGLVLYKECEEYNDFGTPAFSAMFFMGWRIVQI